MASPTIEKLNEGWKVRALRQCRGNQTMTGCIIEAVIGIVASYPPRFIYPGALINEHGDLLSHFQHPDGRIEAYYTIGKVSEVVDDLRQLADKLKLSDDDRRNMFHEVRKWIIADERAIKTDVLGTPKLIV